MTKRIYLKFGSPILLQTSIDALPVTLSIYDEKGRFEEKSSYLSIMPESLSEAFQQWRKNITPNSKGYGNDVRRMRVETIPEQNISKARGVVNFQEIANDFKHNLNQWLHTSNWFNENGDPDCKIPVTLEKYCQLIEEVQIFVQTEDRKLRGLPWQEADIFTKFFDAHKDTELSISATDFERPDQKQTLLVDSRIRILAIFGDTQLGLEEEKELLLSLDKHGGSITTLPQPDLKTLEETLQDPKGWHILFFAGHSGSDHIGKIGWIGINEHDKLEIGDLTELIKKLVNDKLQLAIFNSCDGLGLANQLTSLNLPYCIVMREEVESTFARQLLKHLLKAFVVKEKSIFSSVRFARERLREEFDEEKKHSGKSWLPAIVANPEARSLTWDSMFVERCLTRRWEFFLFGVILLATMGLPLSIFIEFGGFEALELYAQLYPHLIVYPSIFLGISIYSLYRAICLIRQKGKVFWRFTLGVVIFSIIAVSLDLSSDPILLFEIKPNATSSAQINQIPESLSHKEFPHVYFNINNQAVLNQQYIKKSAQEIVRNPSIKENSKYKEFTDFFKTSLKYEYWKSQLSFSRLFYTFVDLAIFLCGFEIFALLIQNLWNPSSVFKSHKYFTYMILCDAGLLLWVPFYSYYTTTIKKLLFDQDMSLGNLAGLVPIFILILLIMTLVVTWTQSKTQKYKYIFSITVILLIVCSMLIHIFGGIYFIERIFGIASNSLFITWVGAITLTLFTYLGINYFIDKKVSE
jgi:hypothetical protein